jgi:hypothetical protein
MRDAAPGRAAASRLASVTSARVAERLGATFLTRDRWVESGSLQRSVTSTGEIPRETTSPVEGDGFEPSVPGPDELNFGVPLRFAGERQGAAGEPMLAPINFVLREPTIRGRRAPHAVLMVRIRLPPAASLLRTSPAGKAAQVNATDDHRLNAEPSPRAPWSRTFCSVIGFFARQGKRKNAAVAAVDRSP